MKQTNVLRILACAAAFAGTAAAVFIWRCALTAFLWAGWGGFGGISMEYTAGGARAGQFFLGVPVLGLFFLLIARLGRNIIRKETASRCGKNLFFFAAAVSAGLLFYYMPEPRQTVVDAFSHGIVQAGWVQYPLP